MKKLLALACMLPLMGCGTPVGNYIGTGVDNFENFVTSPKTQLTIETLTKATTVAVCDISAIAQLTQNVASAVDADKSFIGTAGKVYAGSAVACQGLGGLNLGTTVAPAGAVVVGS